MNTAAREIVTSDGVVLRVMIIDDGEYLKRSGTTIVSDAGGGGGVTDHTALTSLAWTSSGHTGTVSRLAGFSGAGAATYYAIGTDVQAYDAGLASLTAADGVAGLPYVTGANTWATATLGDLAVSGGAWTVTDLTIASEAHGDILYRNAANWVRLGAGTAGQVLQTGGAGANPSYRASASQSVLAAGTHSVSIPSWAVMVKVMIQAGGGGGASGGRANVGTAAEGGGGGGSGAFAITEFPTAGLTGPLEVIVGAGGNGATGIAVNGSATGSTGTDGADTVVTDNNGAGVVLISAQGGSKAGGRTGATASELGPAIWGRNIGGNGGATTNGTTPAAQALNISPAGGGGGGAINSGNADGDGATGGKGGMGADYDGTTNGAAGGTTAGAAGTAATAAPYGRGSGGGGGGAGGAGDGSTAGGAGGAGARGSGGGGGGGGHAASNAGSGGNGGDGYAIITFV